MLRTSEHLAHLLAAAIHGPPFASGSTSNLGGFPAQLGPEVPSRVNVSVVLLARTARQVRLCWEGVIGQRGDGSTLRHSSRRVRLRFFIAVYVLKVQELTACCCGHIASQPVAACALSGARPGRKEGMQEHDQVVARRRPGKTNHHRTRPQSLLSKSHTHLLDCLINSRRVPGRSQLTASCQRQLSCLFCTSRLCSALRACPSLALKVKLATRSWIRAAVPELTSCQRSRVDSALGPRALLQHH